MVALHVVLPKTSDADVMARMARKQVNPPLYRDAGSDLRVFRAPTDASEVEPELPAELAGSDDVLALLGEPRFALHQDGQDGTEGRARFTLFRRPRASREVERSGSVRVIEESGTGAAKDLRDALEEAMGDEVDRKLASFGSSSRGVPASASILRWTRGANEDSRARAAVVIPSSDEWIHTVWIEDESGPATADRIDALVADVDRAMGLDKRSTGERPLSFRGSWKRNVFFSVGSSLAFVAVVLGIGWWRLARIEF